MSWPIAKLGDVCRFVRGPFGGALKKDYFVEDGYAVYEQQHAINNQFNKIRYFIDTEKFEEMKRFELSPGDLIMSCSGTMGKIAIVPEGIKPGIINQALLKLSPRNKIDTTFLRYWLQSASFQYLLDEHTHGAAIKNVASVSILKDLEIPLPPLPEQKRIAAILDKADSLRRKNQQAIQLADKFLRAVFLDMFGDPVTNPKGWDVRELDDCLIFLTSGSRGWAKHYNSSGDKFIRIQNVSKNKLLLNDLAYVNAPVGAEANRTKTQIGDVLLSITADLGRAAVVTEEIAGSYINQHLALLRVKQDKLNPRYLAAYLSSEAGVTQFKAKNKSAVKAGLNFTDIRTLNILLPPIELQNKYEELYKKVTFSINSKQESLQFSESLFNSLSQKAFTGKL